MIDVAIDHTSYQSKKNSRKKTTLQVFFVPFTRPVSPSGIYGTLLLLLMLLMTTKKTLSAVFAFIHVELQVY